MIKFKLDDYHRNISDEALITDLKKVASDLQRESITIKAYNKFGKYHSTTFKGRFGSWLKALEKAGLNKTKNLIVTENEAIGDLLRVWKLTNRKTLTQEDYKNYGGKFAPSTISRKFGWLKILEKVGIPKSRNYGITEEQYFENLEEVWVKLGRQPKYAEMQKPLSKYVGGAYERRFGTWRKALERFIEYVNKEKILSINEKKIQVIDNSDLAGKYAFKHKTNRNVSWRLRFIVMRRDNFKCKICGRSPAINPKIILQVDHIIAWANGGETVLENLQTLCMQCNLGKSNLDIDTENSINKGQSP